MGKQVGQFAIAFNLVLKFMTMMALPIAGGLLGGVWLDQALGTTPLFIFVFTFFGLVFSNYAVYRVATRMQDQSRK